MNYRKTLPVLDEPVESLYKLSWSLARLDGAAFRLTHSNSNIIAFCGLPDGAEAALSALLRPRAVKRKRHTLRKKMWRCNSVPQRSTLGCPAKMSSPWIRKTCDVCRPSI